MILSDKQKGLSKSLLCFFVCVLLVSGCSKNESAKDVVKKPIFTADSTMERIQKEDKLRVGVSFDRPGFAQRNPVTKVVSGFDLDAAGFVAQNIFGGTGIDAAKKIEYVETAAKNIESFLQQGTVDMVVSNVLVNDVNQQKMQLTKPFYVSHGDLLTKNGAKVSKIENLNAKSVCFVSGSVYIGALHAKASEIKVVTKESYPECVLSLQNNEVVAVGGDDGTLASYASSSNGDLELNGLSYLDQSYAIARKKGDSNFANFTSDQLKTFQSQENWKVAFESSLGKLGIAASNHQP